MATLELNDVTKVYDDAKGIETAVEACNLTVEDGELVVLVGPSGCGKSTTLRLMAGLETVTEGSIEIGGREVQDLVPSERSVAMVFQNWALYRRMTARENIGYGLKHSTDATMAERAERVEDMARMLDIEELLGDRPPEMSGGQQQRVALGRALVRDPDVFLLDEPLSNLDAKLRSQMRTELQRIHDELDVTTVYVTHDQKEAMTMADRIAIMSDGVVQQVADPEEAYDHPANRFVATFLGSPAMNVLAADLVETTDGLAVQHGDERIARLPASMAEGLSSGAVEVGLRPEDLTVDEAVENSEFTARVTVAEFQGNDNFIHLDLKDTELTARVSASIYPDRGDTVGVSIDPADVYLFDPETEDALKTRTREEKQSVTSIHDAD